MVKSRNNSSSSVGIARSKLFHKIHTQCISLEISECHCCVTGQSRIGADGHVAGARSPESVSQLSGVSCTSSLCVGRNDGFCRLQPRRDPFSFNPTKDPRLTLLGLVAKHQCLLLIRQNGILQPYPDSVISPAISCPGQCCPCAAKELMPVTQRYTLLPWALTTPDTCHVFSSFCLVFSLMEPTEQDGGTPRELQSKLSNDPPLPHQHRP